MIFSRATISKDMPFHPGLYTNTKRIIAQNTLYIANLIALRRWYLDVRKNFMKEDFMEQALHHGALETLELAIEERLKRLGEVANKMPHSIEVYKKISGGRLPDKTIHAEKEFYDRWQEMEKIFRNGLDQPGDISQRDAFLKILEKACKQRENDYLSTVKGLKKRESDVGTSWLQGIVDGIYQQIASAVPGLGINYIEKT